MSKDNKFKKNTQNKINLNKIIPIKIYKQKSIFENLELNEVVYIIIYYTLYMDSKYTFIYAISQNCPVKFLFVYYKELLYIRIYIYRYANIFIR